MISELRISEVALRVTDLDRTVSFYSDLLRFPLRHSGAHELVFAVGEHSSLRLIDASDDRRFADRPGLYHVAFLYPSRAALATAVRRLLHAGYPLTGASDHLVSEAVYFNDPDGNGLELYCDRPMADWPRGRDGLQMDSLPLDLAGLLREGQGADFRAGEAGSSDPALLIGHMHLQVNDLERATHFYCDGLGLDLMQRYGASAVFLSAGGYHHHVGLNTWRSAGAEERPVGSAGLAWYTLSLLPQPAVNAAADRSAALGAMVERSGTMVCIHDPSGNEIRLRAGAGVDYGASG